MLTIMINIFSIVTIPILHVKANLLLQPVYEKKLM